MAYRFWRPYTFKAYCPLTSHADLPPYFFFSALTQSSALRPYQHLSSQPPDTNWVNVPTVSCLCMCVPAHKGNKFLHLLIFSICKTSSLPRSWEGPMLTFPASVTANTLCNPALAHQINQPRTMNWLLVMQRGRDREEPVLEVAAAASIFPRRQWQQCQGPQLC